MIGVSNQNPQLHVFDTVSHPNKPLYIQRREWEALRGASGPIEVLDWACGGHGAETETTLAFITGRERTEAQWNDIYRAAGFEIRSITPIHDNFGTSIVEGGKQRG